MLALGWEGVFIPGLLELTWIFAAGAVVTLGLVALVRAGLRAALEPQGHRLDRWRRVWLHPERELALLLEVILVLAFVFNFVERYALPMWATPVVVGLWALHLPTDFWAWLRCRRHPESTRELHERGFLRLELGPLWLRALVGLVAAGVYLLIPPLRSFLDRMMGVVLAGFERWLV